MKRFSKAAIEANKEAKQKELQSSFDRWFENAKGSLTEISVKRKTLRPSGDSDRLVRRLAKIKEYVKLETQARNAAKFLESLAEKPLIYNADIPEFLNGLAEEERERKRLLREKALFDFPDDLPGIDFLRFPNKSAMEDFLSDYPRVQEIMVGALEAYTGDGADRYRQALGSCRNALDALGEEVTEETKWRPQVKARADKRVWKIFRECYSLLSKLGAHPGGNPSEREAQFGIRQTMVCVAWLVENNKVFAFKLPQAGE